MSNIKAIKQGPEFKETLKGYRLIKGLTESEMAAAIGKTLRTYLNYENGRTEIGLGSMIAISRKLGYTCDELFSK